MGGTWWPGSLLPSPLLLPHGWSLETPSVTLPGSLDLDKAFVPFFSSRINKSGSNKYKIFGTEREGGQKTEGRRHGPLAPPGCEETQPLLRASCLEAET